ncbi:hypothetical protein D3C81_1961330 [compost metagenome]
MIVDKFGWNLFPAQHNVPGRCQSSMNLFQKCLVQTGHDQEMINAFRADQLFQSGQVQLLIFSDKNQLASCHKWCQRTGHVTVEDAWK